MRAGFRAQPFAQTAMSGSAPYVRAAMVPRTCIRAQLAGLSGRVFGGGGFYMGGPRVGGSLGGIILLVLLILLLTGRLG